MSRPALSRLRVVAWLTGVHLLMAAIVSAADISGFVVGPDEARLPGVVVIVSRGATPIVQVVSDDTGGFHVSGMNPGRYELHLALTGFRPEVRPVDVAANQPTTVTIALSLEPLAESVVVTGALARDSVEAPRLSESGARDIGEALASTPGLARIRRGAIASDVVLNGYQGDNLTVLLDGVRLYGACPNNMDHPAFHVDFSEVERIEIGKGPFDVRHQGALGGVVNVVTKRPAEGFHLTPQVAFGSFGYVNPTVTASFGAARFAALGGYSVRVSNPYRDGSGRSLLAGANYRDSGAGLRAFDVQTGWARVDLRPARDETVDVGLTRQSAGLVLYPYLQMDATADVATRGKIGWASTRRAGALESVRAEAYATRVVHAMTDEHRTSSAPFAAGYSMSTSARTSTFGFRADATASGGTTFGVEAYDRRWGAETRLAGGGYRPQFSVPETTVHAIGAFVDYARPLGERLRFDLGGRLDRVGSTADPAQANVQLYRAYHGTSETSAVDVSPAGKATLTWRIGSGIVVSGGVGRTARVPDPQERYFALSRTGTDWVGDPGLVATTNAGIEASIDWRRPRLFVSATAHRDALSNYITIYQQQRLQDQPGVANRLARSYAAVDAVMSGAEAEGTFSITDRLFVAGDVSGVRGRQTPMPAIGVNGDAIAEIPPIRGRIALRYDRQATGRGWFGIAEVVHATAQTRLNVDVHETATPGYTVVNLKVGVSYRALRVALGLGNLFDRTYAEHLSYQRDPFRSGATVFEPGRNLFGDARLIF